MAHVPESEDGSAWLLQVKDLWGSERWGCGEEVLSLRVLGRDEFVEVNGKRVVVDEVVSDDLVVVTGFTEKEEMVLKAKVGDDAIIGDDGATTVCLECGERKWITMRWVVFECYEEKWRWWCVERLEVVCVYIEKADRKVERKILIIINLGVPKELKDKIFMVWMVGES